MVIKRLEQLCEGLIYLSETDSGVESFQHENRILTFEKPAKAVDFETFIDNQIRMSADWQPLKDYMIANLRDLQVIKVGSVEIDVYGVGFYEGNIYGFRTKGVET